MVDTNDELRLRLEYDVDTRMVTVTVSGDIDLLTAPAFEGVLDALVDEGRQPIVVDLASSDCVDGRGAAVFTRVAERALIRGGTVEIRSASEITRRMLSITGNGDLVVPGNAGAHLGPSGDTDASAPNPNTLSLRSGVPALPRSSTDVVDAALRLVTALADATVTNADGASVTLERHGRLMTVAASNDKVLTMDRHQYETGEGPCLDAKAQGRWFYIESLADETRWPTFVPLALEQGIHSILSSPLKTTERSQGALNIYSSTEHAFGERDQELAALLADRASLILSAAGPELTEADRDDRFTGALVARQRIHQAQGIVMARDDLDANDALNVLFRSAREANVTVLARATELIASLGRDNGDL